MSVIFVSFRGLTKLDSLDDAALDGTSGNREIRITRRARIDSTKLRAAC